METPVSKTHNPPANSCSHLCSSCVLRISSAKLSQKKLENSAYFTFRVNGNKIPQWMSADVFDTNSHFPICCLIEHDEWLESEKRRDKWQHLGSIACPIDSPSLLLLQPSWLLCPPHKPVSWGRDDFLEAQLMEKGRVALSYHSKIPCLVFVNIYKYTGHSVWGRRRGRRRGKLTFHPDYSRWGGRTQYVYTAIFNLK